MSNKPEMKKPAHEDKGLLSDEQLETVDGGHLPLEFAICSISFTGTHCAFELPIRIPGEIKASRFASEI